MNQILSGFQQDVMMIELEAILPNLKWSDLDRHPKTVYGKLFMQDCISEKRVLYLDSDVVVNGSLESLFFRPMDQEYVAGVLMPYSGKLKKKVGAYENEPYICDGVVLFNLELWRQEQMAEQCALYIKECGGIPPMLSEGTLNHVCRGMLGVLEPKYNLMPSMIEYSLKQIRQLFRADYYYQDLGEMREANEHPVIIHFMNELYNRPWFEPCDHPWKEKYYNLHERLFKGESFQKRNVTFNTRLTRILRCVLPFSVFLRLYYLKHRDIT